MLVVDDEEFVRETLAEMVEALGHNVRPADGGRAALDALERRRVRRGLHRPLDARDGRLGGRARGAPPPPRTRIAIVTGYGKDADAARAATPPADTVIGKPFDFAQVERR